MLPCYVKLHNRESGWHLYEMAVMLDGIYVRCRVLGYGVLVYTSPLRHALSNIDRYSDLKWSGIVNTQNEVNIKKIGIVSHV